MSNRILIACETVQWQFSCPKRWSDLEKTGDSQVRFCRECMKPVYRAKDRVELKNLASQGLCVAWREADALNATPKDEQLPGFDGFLVGLIDEPSYSKKHL